MPVSFETVVLTEHNLATSEEQSKIIFCSLAGDNEYLDWNHVQCWLVTRIIHSLVQVNPSLRDVEKAMRLVNELERSEDEQNKI